MRACQAAEHAEPPAGDLVGRVLLARQLLPGGEDLGRDAGRRPRRRRGSRRRRPRGPARSPASWVHAARARAVTSPAAEPQAPSIVAARPFFRAASTLGKPAARWICRVRSLSSGPEARRSGRLISVKPWA